MSPRISLLALLTLSVPLGGCMDEAPPDDAGDVAFVRQLVPLLLGRNVKSQAELRVLVDLAAHDTYGRGAVVDTLMARDEFIDYWTLELADQLGLNRGYDVSQLVRSDCFDAPIYTYDDPLDPDTADVVAQDAWAELADHIFVSDPAAPFEIADEPVPFNMLDVLRASIATDNLYPAYRAGMFPLAGAYRDVLETPDLRDQYYRAQLGRERECSECHNGRYATTDYWNQSGHASGQGWDRFNPVGLALEESLWSRHSDNCPTPPPLEVDDPIKVILDWPPSGATGLYAECQWCHYQGAGDAGVGPLHEERIPNLSDETIIRTILYGSSDGDMPAQYVLPQGDPPLYPGWSWTKTPQELRDLLDEIRAYANGQTQHDGTPLYPPGYTCLDVNKPAFLFDDGQIFTDGSPTAVSPWGVDLTCGTYGTLGPYDVDPALAPIGHFAGLDPLTTEYNLVGLARQMDDVTATNASTEAMDAQNNTAQDFRTYAAFSPRISPESAVPLLVSESIVRKLARHGGAELTIHHQHPRNPEARADLEKATRMMMLNQWSLKKALRWAALSSEFNRLPPSQATLFPYIQDMLYDPWVAADPRPGEPAPGVENDLNGKGDQVHRHTPNALFNSVSEALDWPRPQVLYDDDWPSAKVAQAIGQQGIGGPQSFEDVTFTSFLAWEAEVGTCDKPASMGVDKDWIEHLMDDVLVPANGRTVHDTAAALKYRITGTQLYTAEWDDVNDLFDQADTVDLAATWIGPGGETLEEQMRVYCGVLVTTPQFMLANLRSQAGIGPDLVIDEVCSTTELNQAGCSCADLKADYEAILVEQGLYDVLDPPDITCP